MSSKSLSRLDFRKRRTDKITEISRLDYLNPHHCTPLPETEFLPVEPLRLE